MTTILTAIEAHVQARPDHVFSHLVESAGERKITYGELWTDAMEAAGTYRRFGIAAGSVVLIMLRHSPDLYRAFLGALMIGAVPSFMPHPSAKQDPELFWRGHQALFDRIAPAALVGYADIAERLTRVAPAGAVVLDAAILLGGSRVPSVEIGKSEETAFLQHSSGTTGSKKGVMLTHRAVLAQARDYGGALGLGPQSVVVSWLPLYHDMGLIACFILPLITGASIVHLDPFDWVANPLLLFEKTSRHAGTHIWLPNFAFNLLVTTRRRFPTAILDLKSLQMVINCSEPCKLSSMQTFEQSFGDCGLGVDVVRVCYAMAETVFAVTQTTSIQELVVSRSGLAAGQKMDPLGPGDSFEIASCGKPIPGMSVEVRDSSDCLCREGVVGEVCVQGSSVYDGYFKLPDVTAAKYREGWHHTGDLGFLWEGTLFVTGRMDDLIIVRGRNFYAHDIEAIVSTLPGVKPGRAVVFAVENEISGTADSVCLLEMLDGANAAELRRLVKNSVESQSGLILSKVAIVAESSLVKTTSGKISREANKARYLEGQSSSQPA